MKTMLALLLLFATNAQAECCNCQCVSPNQSIDAPAPVAPPVAPPVVPPVTNGDPGAGSWTPMAGRLIAGQSGPTSAYLTSYVPGCLNGLYITTASASGCGGNSSYGGFSFGSGRTLGLRYTAKPGAGAKLKYFTLASGDGGNVGQNVKVWLSPSPTASYEATPAACKSASTTQPYVITGPGYCPVVPDGRYYLMISTDSAAVNLRYLVNENASDFY